MSDSARHETRWTPLQLSGIRVLLALLSTKGVGGGGKGKTFPQGFFTVGFSLYDMIAEPLHYILSWYLITGKAEPNRRLLTLQS